MASGRRCGHGRRGEGADAARPSPRAGQAGPSPQRAGGGRGLSRSLPLTCANEPDFCRHRCSACVCLCGCVGAWPAKKMQGRSVTDGSTPLASPTPRPTSWRWAWVGECEWNGARHEGSGSSGRCVAGSVRKPQTKHGRQVDPGHPGPGSPALLGSSRCWVLAVPWRAAACPAARRGGVGKRVVRLALIRRGAGRDGVRFGTRPRGAAGRQGCCAIKGAGGQGRAAEWQH